MTVPAIRFVDSAVRPSGSYQDFIDSASPTAADPPLLYVAGPIDFVPGLGVSAERYLVQRAELVDRLRTRYGPRRIYAAWEGTQAGHQTPEHASAQEEALNTSIALVAFLPESIPSVGVPIEIYRVASSGRPVIVIGGGDSQSLAGLGGVTQVRTVDEAIDQLDRALAFVMPPPTDLAGLASLSVLTDPGMDWAMPTRHYPDDAGLDLYVTEQVSIPPDGFADVASGFRLQLPEGTFGLILGRSSTPRQPNRRLLVVPAVIDVGWRGPMRVGVINAGQHQITVSPGERLAQLVLLPNLTAGYAPRHVVELEPHPRGENGFGSTGVGAPIIDSEASAG